MALVEEFVGGMYRALSPTMGADMAVNVYAETRRAEGSSKTRWLLGTPGLKLFASGAGAGCRGWFSQDGVTLVTIGSNLYRVDTGSAMLTLLGSIVNNGEPVSYSSNGQGGDQIAVVGGDELKIIDIPTMVLSAPITLPFSGPVQIVFLDGYFLINQRTSPIIWFSAIEDGTLWDALDFIARSGTSDNLVGIRVSKNRIWAFGTRTTTLFYDSGDADTPFLPYPETATQVGAITPWAISVREDVVTWLAQDATGVPRVVRAVGDPTPNAVSTPPIDLWLRQCSTLAHAECLPYQQDGHTFWALTCQDSPDDVKTYVWDETEQLWHARAGWDAISGMFTTWHARGVAHDGQQIFVGDVSTGSLYTLDTSTYTDNGSIIRRLRRTPYLSSENQFIFIDQVELGAQVGVGLTTGQGVWPLADLRISRDAAKTWISAGSATVGALGDYLARCIWRRLGRVRGDRLVLEVTQTDPVFCAWLGLWLRSTGGTGQL